MKKIIITLFSLLVGILCYAQPGYISTILIDSLEEFTPKTVYICSDNSVVILGNAGFMFDMGQFWDYGPLIIKLDPQGNLMWHQMVDCNTFPTEIVGIEIDENDVTHFIISKPFSYRIGFIDANGSFVLHEEKSFSYQPHFNKAIRMPSGEILACGRIRESQNYEFSAAFFRMSALGDSLAASYYPPDTLNSTLDITGRNMVQKDDNSVYIACYLGSGDLSILHADLDGVIINRYDISGSSQYFGMSMFCNSDSLMVFTVEAIDLNFSTILSTIDAMGDLQSYSIGSDFYGICSVASTPDFFVLLGSHQMERAKLAKYDYSLQNIWSVDYNEIALWSHGSFYEHNTDILKFDQQGCIYFVGIVNFTDIAVMKLLPNGQVPNLDEVQATTLSPITAYPNPAQNSVTIELGYGELNKAPGNCIEIFNIKGQKVRSIPMGNAASPIAHIVWNRRDNEGRRCPTGVYLIRETNNPQNTKKITLVK
jgi:hypothetical protein